MQVEKLQTVLDEVTTRDTSADTVPAVLREALEALETRNAEKPVLLRGTQASLKQGRFKVNSCKRNVKSTDHCVFLPFPYGEMQLDGQEVPELQEAELCIMKVANLWLLRFKGQDYRFATGTLIECDPVPGPNHVMGFCDGSLGRQVLVPSLLTSKGVPASKKYPYAVWLSQIHCTCLSTSDGLLFKPAVKTVFRG